MPEPTITENLKTTPNRATLESLIQRMRIRPRDLQLIDLDGRRVS